MNKPAAWWASVPWDASEPLCVKCGHMMQLNDGCEWDDDADMNLCHSCALDVIREMRKTNEHFTN